MSSSSHPPFDVHRVAVIGAGPAGLITARYLLARATVFTHITVFEQQTEVGGIWNYSPEPVPACQIPSTSPFVVPDDPISSPQGGAGGPLFPSPMYDRLHANIPAILMRCIDKPFPADARVFPSRKIILDYLIEYATEVRHLIRFGQRVEKVRLRINNAGMDKWDVTAREMMMREGKEGRSTEETFDAVVVAVGHYNTPFIPDIPGIREFAKAHPSVVIHSKMYRKPDAFRGKKVIVVGNGPSGLDITRQICEVCRPPIFLSVRTPTSPEKLAHTGAIEMPEIISVDSCSRAIRFSDGRVETDVDAVVLCTGFLYTFPFLSSDLERDLLALSGGRSVHNTFQHLFHIAHPTLVFSALLMSAVPFPLSEAQAGVVAAVWANVVALPTTQEMAAWSQRLEEKVRDAGPEKCRCLQRFKAGEDGLYINQMAEWAGRATGPPGKEVPVWDDKMLWVRRIYADAKLRFERTGATAKTLEELGFVYSPH